MEIKNELTNMINKIYDSTKQRIEKIILENKIESKFKNESSSYSLYIKDSMFVFKLYGYLLNDRIIIYGKHNIPNYSIIVNDNTQDTYCITSSKDYVIKITLDNEEYTRSGILLNYTKDLEEVKVIKVGKKYYKYKG